MTPDELRAYNRAKKRESRARQTPTQAAGERRRNREYQARPERSAPNAAAVKKLRERRYAAGLTQTGAPRKRLPKARRPRPPKRNRAAEEAAAARDAELTRAEQHLEDAIEAYQRGVRNFRRFEREPGVAAARKESARRGVVELRREALRAQAELGRLRHQKRRH